MSAATTASVRPSSSLSAIGLLNSEWIKLRSLRSTVWSYAIVIVASLGTSVLISAAVGSIGDSTEGIPVFASTFGIYFGQLIVGVLGVLVISGEYSTGMIRSTLTAVPRRLPALAAKAVVLFLTTFVVGLVSVFGALLVSLLVLSGTDGASTITAEVLGSLVLAALYLGFVSLFALGLGTILRNGAGGIAATLGVILLLPTIISAIAGITNAQWAIDISPYLFSAAGSGMYSGGSLEPWQNTLVVLAWIVVALGAGAVLLKRRDA